MPRPTMKEHLARLGPRARARYIVRESPVGNPLVRCRCGRRTNADMMTDVRAIPAGARSALGVPDDADFLCDADIEQLFRGRPASLLEAFTRALGDPSQLPLPPEPPAPPVTPVLSPSLRPETP